MNKLFWTNALVIGLRILFGIAMLAFGIYLRYRRLMRRSVRHDLLEKPIFKRYLGRTTRAIPTTIQSSTS